ncbi:hypothetical protein CBER1_02859 [Cercospora berteroae]|uniref:Uncharacterized protein n=1 Tax=Cercospora berteroae TaxID=357750 RepID=A0A2S6BQP0_9PEZI|nr:hypothetical protein CBER1_02859 [Cercospora berteroae]
MVAMQNHHHHTNIHTGNGDVDDTAHSAVDWNFPSPGATPTSAAYTPNVFHTPKTASFPSHFHDAFATPQMASYTPCQADFPDMHAAQRPHTAAPNVQDTRSHDAHMHMNAHQHGQAMPPPPGAAMYQNFIMSPMYDDTSRPQTAVPVNPSLTYDTVQMQTPPPTRGSSVKKPQMQEVAFGTPSTIASRRFASPNVAFLQRPMQDPQLHMSPNMYQFGNFGPATAPAMPQAQLRWDQHGTPVAMQQQRPMLDDPFAPNSSSSMQWSQTQPQQYIASPTAFNTPAMNSFSLQPATQRPASAVQLNYTSGPVATTTSVDPSLVYSSPIRPPQEFPQEHPKTQQRLQPSALESNPKPKGGRKAESKKPEHKRTDTTTTVGSSSTGSSSTLTTSRPVLARSNTTGTARPQSMQSFSSAETWSRRNSVLQEPRTASPLKRVGRTNLGSISENRKARPPSVILTVDEFGRARAVRTDVPRETGPTKAMRERYPGLYDSDSSEDEESEGEKDIPSRSTSFTFTKGEDRNPKIAKLDPPIEGLDGLSIPRTSSAASMKVAPSRASIAAAAQLRRGNSLRKRNPSRNSSRRANNSAATSIDTAPMDVSSDRRQSFIGSEDFDRGLTLTSRTSFELDAHNRRWRYQPYILEENLKFGSKPQVGIVSALKERITLYDNTARPVPGWKKPLHLQQQTNTMPHDRSSPHRRSPHGRHHDQNFPPQRYCDLSHHDMLLLAPLFRPMPLPLDPSYATHASALPARILELPAHLLLRSNKSETSASFSSFASRFSSSSTNDENGRSSGVFCELHKNLSPRPIESLVRCLKSAVHLDELKTYDFEDLEMRVLGDLVVTWGSSDRGSRNNEGFGCGGGMSLDVKYGPVSAEFVEDDEEDGQEVGGLRRMLSWKGRKKKERRICCAACKLSNIAGDLYGLQILGALVAGDVGRRNWRASKRMRWMEIWYASVKGENRAVEMREVVKPMWEMAVEFARYRYDASGRDRDSGRGEEGRDWIEEFQEEVVQNKRKCRQEGREEMGFQHQVPLPDPFVDGPLPDPFVDGPQETERRNGAETWYMPSPPVSPQNPLPARPRRRAPDAMSTASSFYSQHSAMNDWDGFRQPQEPLRPMATPSRPPTATPSRPHERYLTPSSANSNGPQSSGHGMSTTRRDPASTISQIIGLYDR